MNFRGRICYIKLSPGKITHTKADGEESGVKKIKQKKNKQINKKATRRSNGNYRISLHGGNVKPDNCIASPQIKIIRTEFIS